jgi:hypothetical protein
MSEGERGRNDRLAVQRDGNGGVDSVGEKARRGIASPFTRVEKRSSPLDHAPLKKLLFSMIILFRASLTSCQEKQATFAIDNTFDQNTTSKISANFT